MLLLLHRRLFSYRTLIKKYVVSKVLLARHFDVMELAQLDMQSWRLPLFVEHTIISFTLVRDVVWSEEIFLFANLDFIWGKEVFAGAGQRCRLADLF